MTAEGFNFMSSRTMLPRELPRKPPMSHLIALLTLLAAALLEAGGDALVRLGLHGATPLARGGFLALGALALFAYGLTVNMPAWDFGRLLGVYVVLFFVVAQAINWLGFGMPPTLPLVVGGGLIVAGGLTITFWRV
jgi:hypothetical protein